MRGSVFVFCEEERPGKPNVGGSTALATMSAYIDLNPARASLVADPKDYRWCVYAAALAAVNRAHRVGDGERSRARQNRGPQSAPARKTAYCSLAAAKKPALTRTDALACE